MSDGFRAASWMAALSRKQPSAAGCYRPEAAGGNKKQKLKD